MELTPQILIVVLPLIFLGGFVDSVAGGGGLITLPAYLMAGIPAHLAAGTNKVVNGCGALTATFKYFRSGKILLRPAIAAAVGALIGSALGTELAAVISEKTLETLMLIALPCVAVFLTVKKDFGKESDAPAREYTAQQELVRAALIGLGLGCFAQRIALLDIHRQLAAGDHFEQVIGHRLGVFGIVGIACQCRPGDIQRTLLRQDTQVDPTDSA